MQLFNDWCEKNNRLDLLDEWDYDKNGELKPANVGFGSAKKVWWIGKCGHNWDAAINSRTRGLGCPYCSGKRVLKGFNDLATNHPKIAEEWDYSKNGLLIPEEITSHSHNKVWWRCKFGHEWQAIVKNRISGTGCPVCSRSIVTKKRIEKFIYLRGDLESCCPELAMEWHPLKNGSLTPNDVTKNSNLKVWWKCFKGHEWQAIICDRTRASGKKCPYCSGKRIIVGENDLETTHPEIVKEWHPVKNGNLTAKEFSYGSHKRVWWKCSKGHEWQTPIAYRTIDKTGCPICAKELQTSFPEQAILYYIRKCFSDVISNDRKILSGKELDIYIPSIKTAIEYDGEAWHKNTKRDNDKTKLCFERGIRLIRIRESGCKKIEHIDDVYDCVAGDKAMLSSIIRDICLDIANNEMNIDVERDTLVIQEQYIVSSKEKSLAEIYPELVSEWHTTKNGKLNATMFFSGSGKTVWWKCEKGHEWQSKILNRVHGRGCPYCSGRYPIVGKNDLETVNPILAKEWNKNKNGELKPSDVLSNSGKRVWWICEKGHEWQDSINHRAGNRGCPYCSGHKILIGFNDLESQSPEIAKEWHPTKNGNITPSAITLGSNKKIWWLCAEGHEWEASVISRKRGTKCPICAQKIRASKRIARIIEKRGSLEVNYPELSKEWHPTKNGTLMPCDVTQGSHKKVWWKCSRGHEWEAIVKDRVRYNKCPICKKRNSNKQGKNNDY